MAGKKYLIQQDFYEHALWKWDEKDNEFYPINDPKGFPEHARDIYIKAKFTTPNGLVLQGYIIGVYRVFSMALFVAGKQIIFNYNLPKFAIDDIDYLIKQKIINNKKDLFPLKYETQMPDDQMKNFSGIFDVFNKELCKNDHSDKQIY